MKSGQYDIVHTHSSVAGVVGRLAAVSADVPVILHHVHGWGIQEGMPARTRLLYLWLERFCGRFTDRVIAVYRGSFERAGAALRLAAVKSAAAGGLIATVLALRLAA